MFTFLFGHFIGLVINIPVDTFFNNLTEKELFIYVVYVLCDITIFFSYYILCVSKVLSS